MEGFQQVRAHMILQRDGRWAYRRFMWGLKRQEVKEAFTKSIQGLFFKLGYVPKEAVVQAEHRTEYYIKIARDVHYELQRANARLAAMEPQKRPLWG